MWMGLGQFPNESHTMECGAGSGRDTRAPTGVFGAFLSLLFIIPIKTQGAVVAAPQHPPPCRAWELLQNPWLLERLPIGATPKELHALAWIAPG